MFYMFEVQKEKEFQRRDDIRAAEKRALLKLANAKQTVKPVQARQPLRLLAYFRLLTDKHLTQPEIARQAHTA